MVQIRPRTTAGRPSTKSDEFILTNFICLNFQIIKNNLIKYLKKIELYT